LRYLLDAHPNLACPPESKFVAAFEDVLAYPQALRGLESLGISPDRLLTELGRLTATFLDEFAHAHGKRRWVDKTPNYYRLLPLIDRMFQRRVVYVFIVRHPLDTVDSLARTPAFAMNQPEDPEIARAVRAYGHGRDCWARYWLEVNQQLFAFAAANPGRCMSLRYEDLVASPEPTLESVLSFLGEAYSPGLIAAAFSQSHKSGYGDWKILRETGIHFSGIDKWRSWPPEVKADIWTVVGTLAERLGYKLPNESGVSVA
jgi:hypothetical protein